MSLLVSARATGGVLGPPATNNTGNREYSPFQLGSIIDARGVMVNRPIHATASLPRDGPLLAASTSTGLDAFVIGECGTREPECMRCGGPRRLHPNDA